MISKTKKKTREKKYTALQRKTLIVCAAIMVTYVVLICLFIRGGFWSFAAIHTVLAAVTILFIWIGEAPKVAIYIAIFLSLAGAGTAVGLTLFYLFILGRLAGAV